MEFADVTVKESPGLCRCCLSEGCYKDLGTEYSWMNDTEVYADMLLDCFDIGITQHNDGPNGPKRLICEVCITRLRDACNFKKQVVDSEKKFIDMLGRGDFRTMEKQTELLPIYTSTAPMKAEAIEEVTVREDYDDANVDFLDDNDFTDEDELVKAESVSIAPMPSTSTASMKRGRPKKADSDVPEKKPKVKGKSKIPKDLPYHNMTPEPTEYLQETAESTEYVNETLAESSEPKDIITDIETDDQTDPELPKNLEKLRINVKNVVQASTVMPFRWLVFAYRCFYCYDVFRQQAELKSHQTLHNDSEIVDAMNKFWDSAVYIDVSVLNCKLCSSNFDSVDNLIDHLMSEHKIPYDKDVATFQSFKLGEKVSCTVCNSNFSNFGMLLLHTKSCHHRTEDRLCEICGRTFKPHQIGIHLTNEHRSKTVKCKVCSKTFSVNKIRTHMVREHNKLYKCQMCSEAFETAYKRIVHLTTVHKKREPFQCTHCPNIYYYECNMRRHVKRVHKKEMLIACSLCNWKGFQKNHLKQHIKENH